MSEIRVIDLPESLEIRDDDFIIIEQQDGTKKAKGQIINNKIQQLDTKVETISYDFGEF